MPVIEKDADTGNAANERIQVLDLEAVQKVYEADCLKLQTDLARFAEYEAKVASNTRQQAISKVLKLKAENMRGSQLDSQRARTLRSM